MSSDSSKPRNGGSDAVYETVFVRTDAGQQFYDIVISDKSPHWLAKKWGVTAAEIRHYRLHGRKAMRHRKYIIPHFEAVKERP